MAWIVGFLNMRKILSAKGEVDLKNEYIGENVIIAFMQKKTS